MFPCLYGQVFKLNWGPAVGPCSRICAGFLRNLHKQLSVWNDVGVGLAFFFPVLFIFFFEVVPAGWVLLVLVEHFRPRVPKERVDLVYVCHNLFGLWVGNGGCRHSLAISEVFEDIAYSGLSFSVDVLFVLSEILFASVLGVFPGFDNHSFKYASKSF